MSDLSVSSRLVGLRYRWGALPPDGIDCLGLVSYGRSLAGLDTPGFNWMYELYDERSFPTQILPQCLRQIARITQQPSDYDVALLSEWDRRLNQTQYRLGLVESGHVIHVSYIGRVVCLPIPELINVEFYSLLSKS